MMMMMMMMGSKKSPTGPFLNGPLNSKPGYFHSSPVTFLVRSVGIRSHSMFDGWEVVPLTFHLPLFSHEIARGYRARSQSQSLGRDGFLVGPWIVVIYMEQL